MAIQVVRARERTPSTANQFAAAFGNAIGDVGSAFFKNRAQKETAARDLLAKQQLLQSEYGLKGDLEARKQSEKFSNQQRFLQESGLSKYLTQGNEQAGSQLRGETQNQGNPEKNENREIPEDAIYSAEAVGQHGLAQQMREHNNNILKQEELQHKRFVEDRKYHTSFSQKSEEAANKLRESIPKKEMALDFARNAIESGDLSYFSKDKIADITGSDLFRTAKGAQLVTAAKENLLSNMSRVSSRGQNLWFEQRLNSMFPKIGQSEEANLTVQEMLEGEVALDKNYLNEFDRLSDEMAKEGYSKKDIERRARDAAKPKDKEIMKRTTYRMKEIEEQERGLSKLKNEVGKNVVKGTPLTLAMAKLYSEKFKENALKVAEKNGYFIPSIEEYQRMRE